MHRSMEIAPQAPTRLSLLQAARIGDGSAWSILCELYRPLIRYWALHQGMSEHDADDLTQDVMLSLVRHLGEFEHAGRLGSFRTWLKTITLNRVTDFWRSRSRDVLADGQSTNDLLGHLADPETGMELDWERQHDEFVLRSLLSLMELEFEPTTMVAFRRVALEGASAASVAAELNTTVSAVYTARSRVMRRVRQVADAWIKAAEDANIV